MPSGSCSNACASAIHRHGRRWWRYQGRLLAFARGRGISAADAEDLVQETFLHLLRGLDSFRGEASLETYLFLMLRRRVVEWLRGRRVHACLAGEESAQGQVLPPAKSQTVSSYAQRAEQLDRDRAALAAAIGRLVEAFRQEHNFADLQLAEMLFYAQMRNNAIARLTGHDEGFIGLRKHRWINQLRHQIRVVVGDSGDDSVADSLLSEIWEEHRPSCPKRSTVGGYVLGTLSAPWQAYVDFHIRTLGCRFCAANLEDLRRETDDADSRVRQRVMESSVGFFRAD